MDINRVRHSKWLPNYHYNKLETKCIATNALKTGRTSYSAYLFAIAGWTGLHYYRVWQKHRNVSKIFEKSHFEIRHCPVLQGGVIENFWHGCTTTYLPACNCTSITHCTNAYFRSHAVYRHVTPMHAIGKHPAGRCYRCLQVEIFGQTFNDVGGA